MSTAVMGLPAPQVCLLDHNGKQFCLADTKGKWTILYFYPKDDTSGCTIEAKEFSDLVGDFKNSGALVYGISPDGVESHSKFAKKHDLRVSLLSDPQRKFIDSFAVWVKKKMYGREFMGVERSTFLIDPKGNMLHEWRGVSPKDHAKEVLQKLKELSV